MGLGVKRSGAVLLAGLANGPRKYPGPPDLKLDIYLAGLAIGRRVDQDALLMALAGDQEVSELAV